MLTKERILYVGSTYNYMRILACNSHRPKKRCLLLNVYADYSNITFWRLNVLSYPLTSHP